MSASTARTVPSGSAIGSSRSAASCSGVVAGFCSSAKERADSHHRNPAKARPTPNTSIAAKA
jgi:hypothetical protein